MKNLIAICLLLASTSVLANEAEEPTNELNVEILKNKATRDCPYMDSVVLEVKFKIMEENITSGSLLLQGSLDGSVFYTIKNKPFEGTRGSSKFRFDAGDCLKAISVSFSDLN